MVGCKVIDKDRAVVLSSRLIDKDKDSSRNGDVLVFKTNVRFVHSYKRTVIFLLQYYNCMLCHRKYRILVFSYIF